MLNVCIFNHSVYITLLTVLKLRISIHIIIHFLLILPFLVSAEPNNFESTFAKVQRFRHITTQDGLSQNWVRCIYQDNNGFMWFGASGGLNRYDGYKIKNYNLGNVNVNAIAQKSNHELWICNDLGIFIYNQKNDTIYAFHHLQNFTVLCIAKEDDNTIWFGTNRGLFKYISNEDKLYSYLSKDEKHLGLSTNYINTLFLDSNNNVWIGTKTGLFLYSRSTDSFVNFQATAEEGSISGNDITSICEDHKKRIWIATGKNGINLLLPETSKKKFKKIVDCAPLSLLIDKKNILWIGTNSNGGIIQIDLNTFHPDKAPNIFRIKRNRINPESLSDNSIFYMYQDKLNDIWIGTFGGGVNYFSYREKKFLSLKEGINDIPIINNNLVNAIWDEDNFLWIGTEGGLDCFEKATQQTKHYQQNNNDNTSISSDPIYKLYKDSKQNLWVGTWAGGLNLFNYKTKSFKRFVPDEKPGSISSENVFAICEDFQNNLWIGTVNGGLNMYNYNNDYFTTYKHNPKDSNSIYSDIIHDIKITHDRQLLIAANGSLDIFNYNNKCFTHYPFSDFNPEKVRSRFINYIYEDSNHNIWLGTNDGLLLFNKDWTNSTYYTMKDGLPGNTILGILEDSHGNLWISSNNGLSKFVGATKNPTQPTFINFDESDGLAGKEFKRSAVFKNKKGTMFFGTSQGCSYFHPDSIFLNKALPNIVFTKMQLLQFQSDENEETVGRIQNIHSLQKIELPYNKSDFLISFVAINYLNPQKNCYKYKLKGYDSDWVNAKHSHTATYKNLNPGNYEFIVIGSNNDNLWNKKGASLQITILHPWWATLWFKLVAILGSIALIAGLFYLRTYQLHKQKKILMLMVEQRTQELKAQTNELSKKNKDLQILNSTKDKFFSIIAHDLKNPFSSILGLSQLIALKYDKFTDKKRKDMARLIYEASNRSYKLLENLLEWARAQTGRIHYNPEELNLFDILCDIENLVKNSLKEKEINLKILVPSNYQIVADKNMIITIIRNLVTNAVKFCEKGDITITANIEEGAHKIQVIDNGVGMKKEQAESLFSIDKSTNTSGTRGEKGTGLGLLICKEFIDYHKGTIYAESELGKGSVFTISIPEN